MSRPPPSVRPRLGPTIVTKPDYCQYFSHRTMSSPDLQSSNLKLIRDALDKYAEEMKIDLKDNPFADELKRCDSPEPILQLLEKNKDGFNEYRDKNRKFIDCLNPVVKFVHAFSGVLGEATSLVSTERSSRSPLILTPSPPGSVPTSKTRLRWHQYPLHRACFPLFYRQRRSLISSHIRRLKESARATTPSLNSLIVSGASSNASKSIRRFL